MQSSVGADCRRQPWRVTQPSSQGAVLSHLHSAAKSISVQSRAALFASLCNDAVGRALTTPPRVAELEKSVVCMQPAALGSQHRLHNHVCFTAASPAGEWDLNRYRAHMMWIQKMVWLLK